MNERAIELYKQAAAFAYKTAGADAGKGTIVESLTAAKFAELIIEEMYDFINEEVGNDNGIPFLEKVKEHFGVEQ